MYYAYKKYKARQARQVQAAAQREDGQDGDQAQATGVADANAVTASEIAKPKKEKTPEEVAETKRRRKYRWKVVFGLFGPVLLQALDTTIIASALPFIAQDFGEWTIPAAWPRLVAPRGAHC
jgi:hypothetical protein